MAFGRKFARVGGTALCGVGLAMVAASAGQAQLLGKPGDNYKTVAIDWKGGLRYPRLERIEGTPDLLSSIYAPKK